VSASYRIPDEPLATHPRGLVIDPFWALLSVMLGGAALGAALFALNAYFLRGPTWRREVGLCIVMLVGAAILGFGLLQAEATGMLPPKSAKYAILLVVAWKLAVTYWIYYLQQTGFALFEYFGGKAQNGLAIVFIGSFLLRRVIVEAVDHPLWKIVVS
jgi:hypothetical protein